MKEKPQYAEECTRWNGWERKDFDGGRWLSLLPDFLQYCEAHKGWSKFHGSDWASLLGTHPDYKQYCDTHDGWAKVSGADWVTLLTKQPRFAEKCKWEDLSPDDWFKLLENSPDFLDLDECKWGRLKPAHQIHLRNRDPNLFPDLTFLENIPWDELNGEALAILLTMCPELEDQYKERGVFPCFTDIEWHIVLKKQPRFARDCPIDVLNPWLRLAILSLPEIANQFTLLGKDKLWPQSYELDFSCDLLRYGRLPYGTSYARRRRLGSFIVYVSISSQDIDDLINWHYLTDLKPEYAIGCPMERLNELPLKGWDALIQDCIRNGMKNSDIMDNDSIHLLDDELEERLWEYYSIFLRLPQTKIDEYCKEDANKCREIMSNAIAKYHSILVGKMLRPLREKIRQSADSMYPVLIIGESGTGKENTARMLHNWSSRRKAPIKAFNCASSTDDLIESALFGFIKGAFTGAVKDTAGLFKEADNGTLFLDEIAECPSLTQAKLLRVMQWKHPQKRDGKGNLLKPGKLVYSYCPVGATDPEEVDVRIVAATNRKLEQMIRGADPNGQHFREDLYYRLNTIVIETLPLREHREDIEEIANLFWRVDLKQPDCLSREEIAYLSKLEYHANVRELQQLLVQYSIFKGKRTLKELMEEMERISLKLGKPQEGEGDTASSSSITPTPPSASGHLPAPASSLPSAPEDNSSAHPAESHINMEDYICIIDETTGEIKTAEVIEAEHAQRVHKKLNKTQLETAVALGISINTLKKRLKAKQ